MNASVTHPNILAQEGLPTEEVITTVVEAFYNKVQADSLLAPVFGKHIDGHWEEHLATLVDFWSSILLGTRRYRGRPLTVHSQIGEITPAMWQRWLALFADTARDHCSEAVAKIFIDRSKGIAAHLSRSVGKLNRRIVS